MLKRSFDLILSVFGLIILSFPLLLIWSILIFDTDSSGLFFQIRIGKNGRSFYIIKFKTINSNTLKVSKWGKFLRKSKIDELPQLLNILKGEMSFVGPRPDISGYYDLLTGDNRKILELKPGLTSEASLKYANEEFILKNEKNPLKYNDEIIFPDKIRMNLNYYYTQSLLLDIKIILKTIFR